MSEKKSKHPTSVEKYPGSLEELAIAIGSMRYDKVADCQRKQTTAGQ